MTYLPTISEVAQVFPWLHPGAAQPTLTGDEFSMDLTETPAEKFITSVPFTYFFSNQLNKVCEIFTQEYVKGLATYLGHRIKALLEEDAGLARVSLAEVGAGNGRLSHFLRASSSFLSFLF